MYIGPIAFSQDKSQLYLRKYLFYVLLEQKTNFDEIQQRDQHSMAVLYEI